MLPSSEILEEEEEELEDSSSSEKTEVTDTVEDFQEGKGEVVDRFWRYSANF
jgi:hypothetical protein